MFVNTADFVKRNTIGRILFGPVFLLNAKIASYKDLNVIVKILYNYLFYFYINLKVAICTI